MGDIIIEETNHRAFAMTMASFFMLAASTAICIYGFMKEIKFYKIVGLLVAIIFLIGFLAAIIQATKTKILFIITMDGIIDCPSIGGYGFISYKDIKEFEIIHLHGLETIAVILKNRDEFISKLPQNKKRLAKRNLSLNQPAIILHTDLAKDMVPEDILSLLQKRLKDYKRLYE